MILVQALSFLTLAGRHVPQSERGNVLELAVRHPDLLPVAGPNLAGFYRDSGRPRVRPQTSCRPTSRSCGSESYSSMATRRRVPAGGAEKRNRGEGKAKPSLTRGRALNELEKDFLAI